MGRIRGMGTRKLARLALLTAVALALGWAERLIPTPMPGIKLGLSNTVLLYALYLLDIKSAVLLMLLKVFLSGFAYAGVSAMLYSLGGGVASLTMMILVKALSRGSVSLVGVSVVGGVFHNVGQLLVMSAIVSWRAGLAFSPVLLISGVMMGLVTGLIGRNAVGALDKLEKSCPDQEAPR
jgi:heptaprenyl diphosphate synthase